MPSAADDRAAGGVEAGRAGLLAVQPQAPSTRAPITIGAAARIWAERTLQVPPVAVARVAISVLIPVILRWQWLTARRRTSRPSRTAGSAPASRGLRC